ncbi:MAG: hypothetical protein U0487_03755 [Patescibacteria group bacterium]
MTREFATFPTVYQLPERDWQWCLLSEVFAVASVMAQRLQLKDFAKSPEEFVHRFACLAKVETNDNVKKRFFYFTFAQGAIQKVEVPRLYRGDADSPSRHTLKIPDVDDAFVARGWVHDALKAVSDGIEYTGDSPTARGIFVVGIKRDKLYSFGKPAFSHE